MGMCFQSINMKRQLYNPLKYTIDNGWIWLVCRRDPIPREDGQGYNWHIQGTASTESAAVEMCVDETYVIGPIPLDSSLPHDRVEWIGSYFPLA